LVDYLNSLLRIRPLGIWHSVSLPDSCGLVPMKNWHCFMICAAVTYAGGHWFVGGVLLGIALVSYDKER
jgi:hypothetical protein